MSYVYSTFSSVAHIYVLLNKLRDIMALYISMTLTYFLRILSYVTLRLSAMLETALVNRHHIYLYAALIIREVHNF